jgi:hypothetical protein
MINQKSAKIVTGLAPVTPSSTVPAYVSLLNYRKLTAVISVKNGATVTGSDITLKQAKDALGTGEKALAFTTVWANTDTGASDTLVETAVTLNTFTTATTDNKSLLYVIEVDVTALDLDNGFSFVRVGTGNAINTVLGVTYIQHESPYQTG